MAFAEHFDAPAPSFAQILKFPADISLACIGRKLAAFPFQFWEPKSPQTGLRAEAEYPGARPGTIKAEDDCCPNGVKNGRADRQKEMACSKKGKACDRIQILLRYLHTSDFESLSDPRI